jgi:hypothetical protein
VGQYQYSLGSRYHKDLWTPVVSLDPIETEEVARKRAQELADMGGIPVMVEYCEEIDFEGGWSWDCMHVTTVNPREGS